MKIITAIDVCTDNQYGYWKDGVYYAGVGDIGKKFANVYSSTYIKKQEQNKDNNINKRECEDIDINENKDKRE